MQDDDYFSGSFPHCFARDHQRILTNNNDEWLRHTDIIKLLCGETQDTMGKNLSSGRKYKKGKNPPPSFETSFFMQKNMKENLHASINS